MIISSVKLNKTHVILLIALALFVTKFIDYSKWDPTLGGQMSYFVFWTIFIMAFTKRNKLKGLKNPFSFELAVFAISPFFTFFSQMVLYGESFSCIKSYCYCFITALFYLFYASRVKESEIVTAFVIVAVAIAGIQIVQQLVPSIALFGVGDMTKDLEIRNNLLRYRLTTIYFTAFALFYYWNKTISQRNIPCVLMFLLFAVSDYLYLTRQYMAGMAVALLFSIFYIKDKKTKRITCVIILVIAYVIAVNSDSLLAFFIESSKNDATDDNIRLFSYRFYWEKTIDNPLSFLCGSGFPEEKEYWQEKFHLFVSDIGIVGQIFTHGIFWGIAYFTALYKILWKYRKAVPLYIKLFVLSAFVHCSMVASYGGPATMLTWLSVLYISTIHIEKDKRRLTVVA